MYRLISILLFSWVLMSFYLAAFILPRVPMITWHPRDQPMTPYSLNEGYF